MLNYVQLANKEHQPIDNSWLFKQVKMFEIYLCSYIPH